MIFARKSLIIYFTNLKCYCIVCIRIYIVSSLKEKIKRELARTPEHYDLVESRDFIFGTKPDRQKLNLKMNDDI